MRRACRVQKSAEAIVLREVEEGLNDERFQESERHGET